MASVEAKAGPGEVLAEGDNLKYAGIGSRQTPAGILDTMENIGRELASKGYILRSGGADGADSAFERGCDQAGGKKEIFLPWAGFNDNPSPLTRVSNRAMILASQYHPGWFNMSQGARKLHARNGHQVLGEHLNSPVDFIVCWTKDGKDIGGTAQAMRIARAYNIRIYNLATEVFALTDDIM